MKLRYLLSILGIVYYQFGIAQVGPAGIGTGDGASGPRNVIWLQSGVGISQSGGFVDSWADQSGNGFSAAQGVAGLRPAYTAINANLNNMASLDFTPGAAANYHLLIGDDDLLDNSTEMSFFIVYRSPAAIGTEALMNKRVNAGSQLAYRFFTQAGAVRTNISSGGTTTQALGVNTNYILSSIYDGALSGNKYSVNQNSTTATSTTGPVSLANFASDLFIGAFNLGDNRTFQGDIAEIIIYRDALTAPERIIIDNYLSQSFGIGIGTNDGFGNGGNYTSTYFTDFRGIGTEDGTVKRSIDSSDALSIRENNGSLNATEFVQWAHDGTAHSDGLGTNLGEVEIVSRWARDWYLEATNGGVVDGGSVSADILFDFGTAGLTYSGDPSDYVLLYRSTSGGNFTRVTAQSYSDESGDKLVVSVPSNRLLTGYYTLGIGAQLLSKTWYSFQNGNWIDPTTWTLDASLTPIYNNPASDIPGTDDEVIIRSGKTVTIQAITNNLIINSLEVLGNLDVTNSTGHNFGTINGNGFIFLQGNDPGGGLVDNFPSGNVSGSIGFADVVNGGTAIFSGTGNITLDVSRIFKDVRIERTLASDTVILGDDLTIQGNLTVRNGVFRIGDNSATTRTLEIQSTLLVEDNGGSRIGSITTANFTNAAHTLNLYGDFINQGESFFTNRGDFASTADRYDPTNAYYTSDDNAGRVNVHFLNPSEDQTVFCNNLTYFSRLVVDKGVDATPNLRIQSPDSAYFRLLGRANYNVNADITNESQNLNAFALIKGTSEIENNIFIPVLNSVTNYSIPSAARLLISGGKVRKTSGTAIVPYGAVEITNGELISTVGSGITLRESGSFKIDDGTAVIRAFRTSVNGSSAQGTYEQNGGTVSILGGAGISADYAQFCLTYTGNVFIMTGGTLSIQGRNGLGTGNLRGSIFINADPANQNVSGGTLNMISNTSTEYRVTSRAPFYNVVMQTNGGTPGDFTLIGTTAGTGGGADEPALSAQEFISQGDFTIESTATFDALGNNVTVYEDFTIQNGGLYTTGANTTSFEGGANSVFDLNSTGSTLILNDLKIEKASSLNSVLLANAPVVALQVDGILTVEKGNFDYNSFEVDLQSDLVVKDTIGSNSSTGKLDFNGVAAQSITSTGGFIFNMELDNANGLSLAGAMEVGGNLDLTLGVFDVSTFGLTMAGSGAAIGGAPFGLTKMIQTAGNGSDGGLEHYVDGNETITFPLGTNANASTRYTPLVATFSSIVDSGYVKVSGADVELATVLQPTASDVLTFYWRVNHRDFSTLPNVSSFIFTTNDSDDPDGGATPAGLPVTFVPGKVLDETPFTRSSEALANITNFDITFDNGGTPFTLENSNYTAGDPARFVGAPTIYYSRAVNGVWWEWQVGTHWSTDPVNKHFGPPAGSFPGIGDIAVVGSEFVNNLTVGPYFKTGDGRHQIRIDNSIGDVTVSEIIFDSQAGGTALNVTAMSRIRIRQANTLAASRISGTGELVQDIGTIPQTGLIVADVGDFVSDPDNGWFFWFQSATNVTISDRFVYPVFRTFGANNGRLDFSQDVTAAAIVIDANTIVSATTNYDVAGNVLIGSNQSGTLEFPNVGTDLTFECGSITYSNDANNNISVENVGSDIHRLIVNQDISLNVGTSFDLTSAAGAQVELEFGDTGTNSLTNNSVPTVAFYRIINNKGSDTSSSFEIETDFTLSGTTNGTGASSKAVELQNGLLKLNSSGINIDLSTGGSDFEIPSTAGLEIMDGQVNITGADIGLSLDGMLKVNGGTVDMDDSPNNNYIEYSNSGNALIEVYAGVLDVGSQVRRSTTSTTGVLKYRQTGGSARFGINASPETTRSVFEVLNSGSEFSLTGGNFTIVREVNSTTVPTLRLSPSTSSISGRAINLGSATTPAAQNNFGVYSDIVIDSLSIGSSNVSAKIYIVPLEVNNLGIIGGSTFDANGLNLTINENINNDGTFSTNGTGLNNQTTIFPSNSSTSITGSGTTNFWDFEKTGSGTLTTSKNLTVDNSASILAGTLNTQTFSFNIKKDLTHDGIHTSNSAGPGIIFNGSQKQKIGRTIAGTSLFGVLQLQNSSGLVNENVNQNFQIDEKLVLDNGVFDIGGNLLIIPANSFIENGSGGTSVSDFNVNRMVQTNSAINDFGIQKQYNAIVAGSDVFVFPVGLNFYTPVVTTVNDISAGTLTIRPVADIPPIEEDSEMAAPCSDPEIVDADNVLQYYWVVTTSGITGYNGTMEMYYNTSDIEVTAPYSVINYGPARLFNTDSAWDKVFTSADFDETNGHIDFDFTGNSDPTISGIYTAGVTLENDGTTLLCNGAIPDSVPVFITLESVGTGNFYSNASYQGGVAPLVGSTPDVQVKNGFTLVMNVNSIRSRKMTIDSGATLEVGAGTNNHNLGFITGTGTLKLVSNTTSLSFPAGDFSSFLPDASCVGGGIFEFAGSGNYSVLAAIGSVRKILFTESGQRSFTNNATLIICEDLEMLGTVSVVVPDGNNSTTVIGDIYKSDASSFENGGGGSEIILGGSAQQGIFGDFTGSNSFNNLEIDNATGVTVRNSADAGRAISANSDVDVSGILEFSNGLVFTNADNSLTLSLGATATGYSRSRYVDGPMIRELSPTSQVYPFPIGNGNRSGQADVVNPGGFAGTREYTATYFDGGSLNDAFTLSANAQAMGVEKSSENEYWTIDALSPANSDVALYWDTLSDVQSTISNLRMLYWDGAAWDLLSTVSGPSGNQNFGSLTSGNLSYSTKELTFGSVDSIATPLPISIEWFKGRIENSIAFLSWKTLSEINIEGFEIEKLDADFKSFNTVLEIKAQEGQGEDFKYELIDPNPSFGQNYYRLKILNSDGTKDFFPELLILENSNSNDILDFALFPNPTSLNGINIVLKGMEASDFEIVILGVNGNIEFGYNGVYQTGEDNLKLKSIRNLPSGIHFVQLSQNGKRIVRKLVIF